MTSNLVLLSDEREKQTIEDQLIAGLKKLLEEAEKGQLRGVCYATVNRGDALSFGILHTSECGVHELVGVSQMLNFRLIQASGVGG